MPHLTELSVHHEYRNGNSASRLDFGMCLIVLWRAPLGQVFSGVSFYISGSLQPVPGRSTEVRGVKRRVYMDNAATTFPKPPGVIEAMAHFMQNIGANPGRSKHDLSQEASLIVEGGRKKLALLFNIPDANRIAFTLNATESLNTVIYGVLNPGDHVIITQMEHNSVIRPVRHLEQNGIVSVSVAPCDKMGVLDVGALKELIRDNTALIALNHASNVCGTIQDVAAVREAAGRVPLLLDAAQTAGALPIDVQAFGGRFPRFYRTQRIVWASGNGWTLRQGGPSHQAVETRRDRQRIRSGTTA